MGANPLQYLDFGGALRSGVQLGLQAGEQRMRQKIAEQSEAYRSAQLEIERQQENRRQDQLDAVLLHQAAMQRAQEEMQADSAKFNSVYSDMTTAGHPAATAFSIANQLAPKAHQAQSMPPSLIQKQFQAPYMIPVPGGNLVSTTGKFVADTTPTNVTVPEGVDAVKVGNTVVKKSASGKSPLENQVDAIMASQLNAGFVKPGPEASTMKAQLMINKGKLPQLSEGGRTKLAERTATLDGSDTVLEKIDAFNAKYEKEHGKNYFDSYIGKFDAPFDNVLDTIRARKYPEDIEALKILDDYAGIRNGTLKTRSGGTVTQGEAARFKEELGDRTDKNLVPRLQAFRDRTRNELDITLDAYEGIQVPKNLVGIIKRRGGVSNDGTAPSGTRIKVVRNPKTGKLEAVQ